jgi:hypothetical protein
MDTINNWRECAGPDHDRRISYASRHFALGYEAFAPVTALNQSKANSNMQHFLSVDVAASHVGIGPVNL